MPILFQKGILCTSNYNDMEHKPAIGGVELNENTTKADLDLATALVYRGQVATYSALPKSGMKSGDVYNVEDTGNNYAWNGSEWDDLGNTSQIRTFKQLGIPVTNTTIENICTVLNNKQLPPGTVVTGRVALTNFPSEDTETADLIIQLMDPSFNVLPEDITFYTYFNLTLIDTETVPYVWSAQFESWNIPSTITWAETGSIPAVVFKHFS